MSLSLKRISVWVIFQERKKLKAQATHIDRSGALFKMVNGVLWEFKESSDYFGDTKYPYYARAESYNAPLSVIAEPPKGKEMKKKAIKVTKPNGMSPDIHTECEIHISSHGVLCIKKYNRFIKTYAEGKWETAEEVSV